jgi:NAD(P)-dependent dehydrogenase (short-subunit alcohol dehydrogenase family)
MQIDASTIAVVTGAGSGIGRALAIHLAARGAALALCDVNAEQLEVTASRCYGASKVTTHTVDVSKLEAMQEFARAVERDHGGANLVINNAGVALGGTFEELEISDLHWLMGINFWGVVHGTHAFLPLLKVQPRAHLVNVSSVFGLVAPPGQTAYSSAKFAVRGFTESLRHELQEANSTVRISTVHPGGIKTNIARGSRAGAKLKISDAQRQQEIAQFEKSFVTTAEAAAERILRGVERDETRILIGQDATILDVLARAFPATYWRILRRLMK